MNALNRCLVTGNPCGTDTWQAGYYCQCEPCQHYLRVQDSKRRLGPAVLDEIAQQMAKRRQTFGSNEATALSAILKCRKEGHSRNPDGVCVRCLDAAPEPGYEST